MNKVEQLRQIYLRSISEMMVDMEKWKDFLRYSGNMYKYDFVTLVTAFEQNKDYTQLATYDAWRSIGRQVKRGEKSISVLTEKGFEYLFNVTQLRGDARPWIWEVNDTKRKEFEQRFLEKNKKYQNENVQSVAEVRGAMITEHWKKAITIESANMENKDVLMTDFFFQSVDYMVQSRCNYLTEETERTYFKRQYTEVNLATIQVLGFYTIQAGRELLLNSKEIINQMSKENEDERRQKDGAITKWHDDGIRGTQYSIKQIREHGKEVLEGEQANSVSDVNRVGIITENPTAQFL